MSIVVSGLGVVSSLGIGVEENLSHLYSGQSGISLCPEILSTNNKIPVGELKFTNNQLKEKLGIPTNRIISRTALLGMLAVKEAITDAEIDTTHYNIGLVSSTSVGGMDLTEHFFQDYIRDNSKGNLRQVVMHDCAASTQAICNYCTITGYSTTISTACSSSANAIIKGYNLLKHGILDAVVVGGCDALSAFTLNGFKSLMILDKDFCRPFDATRAGLNLGEGAGYIVLQREEDCRKKYCYLAGYANTNDAFHQTASSDNGEGAYLAMTQALAMANLSAEDIDYINAHGTGTPNNDLTESVAIARVFNKKVPFICSTKSYTGHTLAASGGIEAVFSILSLKEGFVPASLHLHTPMDNGITVNTKLTKQVINTVLSNSFGFGGNCSTLIFSK